MNAVILAILVLVTLSLLRVSVVFALIVSALVGGLAAGMPLEDILSTFNDGLGGGAKVALAYGALGAFAVALSRSGLTDLLAERVVAALGQDATPRRKALVKAALLSALLAASVMSQNLIPVHIAFIPVLVPPLLEVMNWLRIDRRAVACVITFGITAPYMLLPVGFGGIYLNDILMANVNEAGAELGVSVTRSMVPMAMAIPIGGMLLGLLTAVFISYRKPRTYIGEAVPDTDKAAQAAGHHTVHERTTFGLVMAVVAIVVALVLQLWTGSMVLAGLAGFALLSVGRVFTWREADDVFISGMRMMALVAFIMIAAAGFASVMKATGEIDALVQGSVDLIGGSKPLAALIMLVVGLFITMGIGSSFSTVPIIAALYVPLAIGFDFSVMATVSLVGTAGALGDAGSPASDSTLGPTAGLNVDGQHDHIWDSVVPTFLHYNLPMLAFGWLAAMVL